MKSAVTNLMTTSGFTKAKIEQLADDLIEVIRVGAITEASVTDTFDRLELLMEAGQQYILLFDLSQADPPYGEARYLMQRRMTELTGVKHIAVFNGNNYFLNLIAQFVLGELEGPTTSLHANREEAIELLQALD